MKSFVYLLTGFLVLLRSLLASNSVQEWTDDQLDRLNENDPQINRLFLVYAEWCGACRRYKPKLHQSVPKLVQLSPSPLEIIQINLDKSPLIGSRFRVSHLPSVFHQIGGEFRKIDTFKEKLEVYFEKKIWVGTPTMGPLSPPRSKQSPSNTKKSSSSNSISAFIADLGVSLPVFVLLSSTLLLFIVFFIIWCIWLYTDYKLNAHNFTDEAIKERIKFLRTQPEFRDEFGGSDLDSKEDSGEESDTETDNESEVNETKPLRGRRSSIKNRLK